MSDMVNRPAHYVDGRQFEPIAVIEDWGLNYRLGCALKYIARAGRKDPSKLREDLQKCAWYLEREIEALKPSQYSVTYEDVLEDFAACAAEGGEPILEYGNWGAGQEVPFTWTPEDELAFEFSVEGGVDFPSVNDLWAEGDDELYVTGWDPSLGPIEISQEEIDTILSRKALDQFDEDEIVSTVERRGMVIGFKKDGSSCILKDGRCV